jgi:large subunit ribosomal protein L34e
MVAGSKRSGSARRVHKVTPGNKTVLRFKKKKVGQARCQITGAKLAAIPRKKNMTNMPKSAKRPSRPFAGVLSPVAMKRVLIQRARSKPE